MTRYVVKEMIVQCNKNFLLCFQTEICWIVINITILKKRHLSIFQFTIQNAHQFILQFIRSQASNSIAELIPKNYTLKIFTEIQEYPHKYQLTFGGDQPLEAPSIIHPTFYGCFDWHSAVHGHWLLAAVRNKFPGTPLAQRVAEVFDRQFEVRMRFKKYIFDGV